MQLTRYLSASFRILRTLASVLDIVNLRKGTQNIWKLFNKDWFSGQKKKICPATVIRQQSIFLIDYRFWWLAVCFQSLLFVRFAKRRNHHSLVGCQRNRSGDGSTSQRLGRRGPLFNPSTLLTQGERRSLAWGMFGSGRALASRTTAPFKVFSQ